MPLMRGAGGQHGNPAGTVLVFQTSEFQSPCSSRCLCLNPSRYKRGRMYSCIIKIACFLSAVLRSLTEKSGTHKCLQSYRLGLYSSKRSSISSFSSFRELASSPFVRSSVLQISFIRIFCIHLLLSVLLPDSLFVYTRMSDII